MRIDLARMIDEYNERLEQKGMRKGMEKGWKKGLEEGDSKARHEISIESLNLGIDPKIVAKATHLTLVEIKKLKASLNKSK